MFFAELALNRVASSTSAATMTSQVYFCLCVFVLVVLDNENPLVTARKMSIEERIHETRNSMERTVKNIENVIDVIKTESVFSHESNIQLIWRLETVNLEIRFRFTQMEMWLRNNDTYNLGHIDLFAFKMLNRYKKDFYDTLKEGVKNLTDIVNLEEQKSATSSFLDEMLRLSDECLSLIVEEVNGHAKEWNAVIDVFEDTFIDDEDRDDVNFLMARQRMDAIVADCYRRFETNVNNLVTMSEAYCKRVKKSVLITNSKV